MGIVTSVLGSIISPFLIDEAFWCVRLQDGRFLSERDMVRDGNLLEGDLPLHRASKRPFDWTLDLVSTGDIKRVRELWLLCPPSLGNPLGQTAKLPVVEPGTIFQFKVAYLDGSVAGTLRSRSSQLIGRVTDKVSGDCECFVWDVGLQKLGIWHSNVYKMGTWREEIAPINALAHDVLGLSLT
jgi:hypothetical protein